MKKQFVIQCFIGALGVEFIGTTYQRSSFSEDFTLVFDTEEQAEAEVCAILNGERAHTYKRLAIVSIYSTGKEVKS